MGISFILENPGRGAMPVRPYMREMNRYLRKVDYCQYSFVASDGSVQKFPYQKPTAIWTNLTGWDVRTCKCEGRRHASSLIGDAARGSRGDFRQGQTPSRNFKHQVPDELHATLLQSAMRASPSATWVLDMYCGTQSLKRSCERLGIKYVGCDILPHVKTLRNGKYHYAYTDIVGDLHGADVGKLIRRAAKLIGESASDILLVWASPPCDTFSCANALCPKDKRCRDFSDPTRPPLNEQARSDDQMVEALVQQLLH